MYFLFIMLILFLYTDVRILPLFDHVDCDNKLLTYLLKSLLKIVFSQHLNVCADGAARTSDEMLFHINGAE